MKSIFKYFCFILLMLLSFYYTEKVALYVRSKNPIVKEIKEKKSAYETKSVNSIIKGETIIPGINGIEVNVEKSAEKMNKIGTFNETYLVYNQKSPEITIEDNKDKIIISGNKNKKQVAIIINNNENILNYSIANNIKISNIATTDDKLLDKVENLNGEQDSNKFKKLEVILDKKDINKHICVINNNKYLCEKYNNYLVMPPLILNRTNIIDIKNNIERGSIILITKSAKLVDYKIMLKKIYAMDLDIVYLSKLIGEELEN